MKSLILIILLSAQIVMASDRANKKEVFFLATDGKVTFDTGLPGWEKCGPDEVDTSYDVYGFGIGYNTDSRWNWSIEYTKGDSDITALDRNGLPLTANVEHWSLTGAVEYYFKPDNFTPYVSAGLGVTSVKARRNPCIHGSAFHILKDDYYAYELGGGLRWDIDDRWFTKVGYRYRASLFGEKHDVHYGLVMLGIKF